MEELEVLRRKIDQLDEALISTLAMRFQITDKVGTLKKAEKLPAVDLQREARQEAKICEIANRAGLREDIALAVLRVIINAVVENHRRA